MHDEFTETDAQTSIYSYYNDKQIFKKHTNTVVLKKN